MNSHENSDHTSNDKGEVEFSIPDKTLSKTLAEEVIEIKKNEDPPSKLIRQFIHKQKASGGEVSLDLDFELEELNKIPGSGSSSKELRVSFHENQPDSSRGAAVLRCTSNSSPQRNSALLRAKKTRSRLMDPPAVSSPFNRDEKKSGFLLRKSGENKSGLLGKPDDDDEDPFIDEDLPEDFKNSSFGTLAILQLVSLILIVAALVCSLSIRVLQRQTVWGLHLWKWEVMVLALICGRLLSGWIIRAVVFFIERNFLLRKRVLYFVYGVRNAVQNCLWLGLVLLTWHCVFDEKVERETNSLVLPTVTKVLVCLLVATLMWLVKTVLIKVLAFSFHVSTYFDRIQESLFNQYVIETLSGPPLIEIQLNNEEKNRMFAEVQKLQNAGSKIPNDIRVTRSGNLGERKNEELPKKENSKQQDAISIDLLHKLNQKNISAWNMKRLMKMVRNGTLSTLDERLPRGHREDESAMQIKNEAEAKIAAKKIFINVAEPGSKYIYLIDFMRFLREDEARKTISLFEGVDENGRVSRRCLTNWVVNAFRERRALSLTLNDAKTAVNMLHRMANILVAIIVVALWLLILNIASTHFFVLIASQLLLAVFMFGNTLKMTFEAIIFLFVIHPFDVGDRCEIEGVQMIVEEMNILTTVFLRYDNQKIAYPNSVLATLPIGNFYRSPDMGDSIDFCVHVSTPLEKIAVMKEKIIGFMESKKDHWYPNPSVVLRDVDDMNRLRMSVWMRHRINFQDMGAKWDRRELVVKELIKILRELDVEYRVLPLDVNVRKMPSMTSRRPPSNWTTCS